jgi:diguanylate cyclase (GGDEF)-like protein/PAS domain S-box-containing protein
MGVLKVTIKKMRYRKAIFFAIAAFLSFLLLMNARISYIQEEKKLMIGLNESVAALVTPRQVERLSGDESDLSKIEYNHFKESFIRFKSKNQSIYFAYLLKLKGEDVVFLVDSENQNSTGYSPPGQVYYEANEAYKAVFKTKMTHVTEPISDRWGTWITVLTPIVLDSGEVVAVLGVDYEAKEWLEKIEGKFLLTLIIVICINIIVQSLYWIYQKNIYLAQMESEVRESESAFRAVFEQAPIGIAVVTEKETIQRINPEFARLMGRDLSDLKQVSWRDLTHPDDLAADEALFNAFIQRKIDHYTMEKRYIRPTGESVWVYMQIAKYNLEDNGDRDYLCILSDMTEVKKHEEEILYLSEHDYLTDLYNRRYFEGFKESYDIVSNLPLSIVVADINGLRLINDAIGHSAGDELIKVAAQLIQKCCSKYGIISRTGGEFRLLLIHVDGQMVQKLVKNLKTEMEAYNKVQENMILQINMSIGYGTKENREKSMQEVVAEAEAYLYKQKLMERKSYRSAQIDSIMATLYARSEETEEHSQRLFEYCKAIGIELDIPQENIDEMALFSMLHDIGKIGIDDRILNKAGSLTESEWLEMKRHPEIGYRIVSLVPELVTIGDYILAHHERWDGTGYPLGLSQNQIPLLARILSVVDAYDAMTEDRVYRKALTKEMAMAELRRHSGTQFDPQIVEIFLKQLENKGT